MTLKKDFEKRATWYVNRSSCIYPLDLKKGSDFAIAFLNYWKLKNKINSLNVNLRFFDNNGTLKHIYSESITKDHYELKASQIISESSFSGMVEIEFISNENMRFAFPGISGFYISPDKLISAAHSAGRCFNSEEPRKKGVSEESNFVCKTSNNSSPFFSLFNSNLEKDKNPIIITLKDKRNKTINKKIIYNELKKPFSNKIFYIRDFFKTKDLLKSSFCTVTTSNYDVFPRMICGNYYKKMHHYEVTHSFPVQKNKKDYISQHYLKDKHVEHVLFLPFVKSDTQDLTLRIFPTNLNVNCNAKLFVQNNLTKKMNYKGNFLIKTGKENFEYNVKKNEKFGFFTVRQKKIPARINTSYIYKNGNKNGFSTDIATGFKSIDYPMKKTHWASFFCNRFTESRILIRRVNHYKTFKNSTGSITFYGKNFKKKLNLNLKPTDYKIFLFEKIYKIKHKNLKSYSWLAKFKKGSGIEIFWNVSGKDFIAGDHSF